MTKDFQHELELVVAMKSGGMNITAGDALSHVFGYAVGLDMTRRDLQTASRQKQQPWEIGKSFDQSAPCSAVTPAERAGHLAKGRIWLAVNGKVRQDADLDLMIWKVPDIIAVLSTQVGLAAGDLIYTGTPAEWRPSSRATRWSATSPAWKSSRFASCKVRGQNVTLTPNCISLGLFALKMRPKLFVPNVRLGTSKFVLLSALKTSQRSSMLAPPTLQVFAAPRSSVA